MTAVASPCVRLCSIEPLTQLCAGCGRTLAEIGAWMRLSGEERHAIMAALPARIAASRDGLADQEAAGP